jgi:hypothetical protein
MATGSDNMDHDKSTIDATQRHSDGLSCQVCARGTDRDAHAAERRERAQLPFGSQLCRQGLSP